MAVLVTCGACAAVMCVDCVLAGELLFTQPRRKGEAGGHFQSLSTAEGAFHRGEQL